METLKPVNAWAVVKDGEIATHPDNDSLEVYRLERDAVGVTQWAFDVSGPGYNSIPVTIAPRREWIEVTRETMPEEDTTVWVYRFYFGSNSFGVSRGRYLGYYRQDGTPAFIIFGDWKTNDNIVSHWMPFDAPEPPQITKDGER